MNRDYAITLRQFGISPSPQRTAIFRYLQENPTHPSAETIYHDIKKILPTISLTTVYNTLKLLAEKRALQEVLIEERELRFDGNTNNHAHFKCMKCGSVFDLFPEKGNAVANGLPELPDGFIMDQLHICMRGYCKDCCNEK